GAEWVLNADGPRGPIGLTAACVEIATGVDCEARKIAQERDRAVDGPTLRDASQVQSTPIGQADHSGTGIDLDVAPGAKPGLQRIWALSRGAPDELEGAIVARGCEGWQHGWIEQAFRCFRSAKRGG